MTTLNLNGTWLCTFPDGERAEGIVPGCYDVALERWDLEGPVLYERAFEFAPDGQRARLVFGAVSYACEITLNGVPLGTHEGMWDGADAMSAPQWVPPVE